MRKRGREVGRCNKNLGFYFLLRGLELTQIVLLLGTGKEEQVEELSQLLGRSRDMKRRRTVLKRQGYPGTEKKQKTRRNIPNGRKIQGQEKRKRPNNCPKWKEIPETAKRRPNNCPKWQEKPGIEKEEGRGQRTVPYGTKIQEQKKKEEGRGQITVPNGKKIQGQ